MRNSPRIAFHGGIGSIGGTKILVQEGEYRVLFDFGLSFAPGGDFWGGNLQPRAGAGGLRDWVTLGYMPRLDGLYRPGECETLGLTPGRGDKTQVFISHLHLDHMAVVHTLSDEIPVWVHGDSLRLFRATAATGERPPVPVNARAFQWGQEIQVGPISVTPVAVDHDIPGASALFIKTSAGTVVYSGDLRMHGPNPERTEAFIAAARAANPKILLIEGTRLGEGAPHPDRPQLREPEVAPVVAAMLREARGLCFITLYPRNTLRMANIARAIREAGRKLVLSPEAAYILRAMEGDVPGVAVYKRHKDAAAIAAGTAPDYLTELFATSEVLDAAALCQDPDAYLLQLFPGDLNELVDLRPQAGGLFIHSNGEPLGPFDPTWTLFERWIAHFGLQLRHAACTGHAAPADLMDAAARINPQVLMPIHSRMPELFEVPTVRRVLPELGGIYAIATGERIG